jgi:hypothetical protein
VSIWAAGNCYGLSSTAVLYYEHLAHFPLPGAPSTSELKFPDDPSSSLNNPSLAVMFHQVYDPANHISGETLQQAFGTLVEELQTGTPVVMIVGPWFVHAVVAYGIEANLDGSFTIKVSDPNFPKASRPARYDPLSDSFRYEGSYIYSSFTIVAPEVAQDNWLPHALQYPIMWLPPCWRWQAPWITLVLCTTPANITVGNQEDYFKSPGDSSSFVCGIPLTYGISEGNVEIYAIPIGISKFTIKDPSSNESTILISRVENVTGQLSYYAYVLNLTSSQGPLSFSVTPQNDSLSIVSDAGEFNASVAFLYSNGQINSTSEALDTMIGENQNFTYSTADWQNLNSTGIQVTSTPVTIPEFSTTIPVILTLCMMSVAVLILRKRRPRSYYTE